jgi:hypothetical protein
MFKHCLLWIALSATGLAQTLQLESGLVTRSDALKGILVLNSPLSCPGQLALQPDGRQLGDAHAFRVQVFDADGQELTMLTRDLADPRCTCTWELPLVVDLRERAAHRC